MNCALQTVRTDDFAENNDVGGRAIRCCGSANRFRQRTSRQDSGYRLGGRLLEQTRDGQRQLSTLLLPETEAVRSNAQALFLV